MRLLSSLFHSKRVSVNEGAAIDRRAFFSRFAVASAASAALFSRTNDASAIDELPEGVTPSNPRELLYPTPENHSVVFSPESGKFAASYPILQNVSYDSASIVWSLNTPSTGWVEWGPTPKLGKIARNSEFGLNPYEEDFLSARILGLQPNTIYYYRTATCAFSYRSAYDKTCEPAQYSDVYSFKTAGPNVEKVSFAVMNDTHNQIDTIRTLFDRFDDINPDFLVWNGDLCHRYPSSYIVKTTIANPCDRPYAAERPLILSKGNHDRWGPFAHKFTQIFTPWIQRNPRFRSLGYNVALRYGPLAIIVLDTADTKADDAPACQGLYSSTPYREQQANWLREALQQPEIANAPYLIAFCHIPLFEHTPKEDATPPAQMNWIPYHEAGRYFGPLFDEYGVQLLIAAHRHKFAYSEASPHRPWAQLLGGGPLMENATCIYAEANSNELVVNCEKLSDRSILGSWSFKPRF